MDSIDGLLLQTEWYDYIFVFCLYEGHYHESCKSG